MKKEVTSKQIPIFLSLLLIIVFTIWAKATWKGFDGATDFIWIIAGLALFVMPIIGVIWTIYGLIIKKILKGE